MQQILKQRWFGGQLINIFYSLFKKDLFGAFFPYLGGFVTAQLKCSIEAIIHNPNLAKREKMP